MSIVSVRSRMLHIQENDSIILLNPHWIVSFEATSDIDKDGERVFITMSNGDMHDLRHVSVEAILKAMDTIQKGF